MEPETNIADRKSRVVYQEAGSKRTEWRAVGKITIFAPELDVPLVLDGGYILVLGDKPDGHLRECFVVLKGRRSVDRIMWFIVGISVGVILLGIRMWLAR